VGDPDFSGQPSGGRSEAEGENGLTLLRS
jgi:hypothetical protein